MELEGPCQKYMEKKSSLFQEIKIELPKRIQRLYEQFHVRTIYCGY